MKILLPIIVEVKSKVAYKVINKSRQGIPVVVTTKDGELKTVDLSFAGENSKCTSYSKTPSMEGLEKMGFIKIS